MIAEAEEMIWEPDGCWWSVCGGYSFGRPYIRAKGQVPLAQMDQFLSTLQEAAEYARKAEKVIDG